MSWSLRIVQVSLLVLIASFLYPPSLAWGQSKADQDQAGLLLEMAQLFERTAMRAIESESESNFEISTAVARRALRRQSRRGRVVLEPAIGIAVFEK